MQVYGLTSVPAGEKHVRQRCVPPCVPDPISKRWHSALRNLQQRSLLKSIVQTLTSAKGDGHTRRSAVDVVVGDTRRRRKCGAPPGEGRRASAAATSEAISR